MPGPKAEGESGPGTPEAVPKADMESRLVASRRQLSALTEEPIWNLRFPGREAFAGTADHLARDTRRIRG